jgi:thioredoxin-dependent peroxiredoxin
MGKLKTGDPAPAFSAPDQNGNVVTLDQFSGKKLVLYFYPKDDTPGCTAEACDLRDNYKKLMAEGYEILGVSPDSQKSHLKFIEKYSLPFSLLSDVDKKILEAYGAWGEKKLYGKSYMGVLRKSFVISEKGTIENIIEKVNTKEHARQIFEG